MIDMDDHRTRCILQGYEDIHERIQKLHQAMLADTKRRHHYEVSGVLQDVHRMAQYSERYRSDLRLSFENFSTDIKEPARTATPIKRRRVMG